MDSDRSFASGMVSSSSSSSKKRFEEDNTDEEGEDASTTPVKGIQTSFAFPSSSSSPPPSLVKASTSASSASEMLAASLSAIRLDDDDDEEQDDDRKHNTFGKVEAGNDEAEESEDEVSEDSANEGLTLVNEGLEAIRAQIFEMQEKRHKDVFGKIQGGDGSSGDRTLLRSNGQDREEEEKGESGEATHASEMDRAMIKTNGLLETVSERIKRVDGQISRLEAREQMEQDDSHGQGAGDYDEFGVKRKMGHHKRSSVSSMASLSSFDEAFFRPPGGVGGLRKRFTTMLEEWGKLQQEVKTVEEELSADKYMAIFTSISGQAQDIMDSLDKALAQCHDFVFAANRERAGSLLGEASASGEGRDSTHAKRLEELRRLKRSFDVKKQSYGPACESMFSAMERGVKERSVKNGSILRRFSELKTRWRSLRERTARMDKELRRIEASLGRETTASFSSSSPSSSSVSPSLRSNPVLPGNGNLPPLNTAVAQEQTLLGYGAAPSRRMLSPKSPERKARNVSDTSTIRNHELRSSSSSSSSLSPSFPRSVSVNNALVSPSSSPPIKPPKSIHRMSMLEASLPRGKENTNAAFTPGHSRSLSTDHTRGQLEALRTPPRGPSRNSSVYPATTSKLTPSFTSSVSLADPIERFGYPSDHLSSSNRSPKQRLRSMSPNPPPTSWRRSTASMNSNGQTTPQRQAGSSSSVTDDSPASRFGDADTTLEAEFLDDSDVSFSSVQQRPSRPASVAGMYYRPPSASGRYNDSDRGGDDQSESGNHSRIPRLSAGQQTRPASSLSHTSSATTTSKIPGVRSSRMAHAAPPSSFIDRGASRDSMMTPEPTIAARARRLNLFAPATTPRRPSASFGSTYASSAASTTPRSTTPSSVTTTTAMKRSSRPPPTRYNATASSVATSTRPLNISKRNSSLSVGNDVATPSSSFSGRATPLSAAALADSQRRLSSLAHTSSSQFSTPSSGVRGGPTSSSSTSSSVANFRASRAAATGQQGNTSNFAGDPLPFPTSRHIMHPSNSSHGEGAPGGMTYARSATSGRATPTFSDSGASAIWGRGAGRAALQRSRPYRPKDRNDPLDAEVAHIVNQLGVQTERVEGQLPGGPNRLVRYEIGGKVIVCKLLELVSGAALFARPRGSDESSLTLFCLFLDSFDACSIEPLEWPVQDSRTRREKFSPGLEVAGSTSSNTSSREWEACSTSSISTGRSLFTSKQHHQCSRYHYDNLCHQILPRIHSKAKEKTYLIFEMDACLFTERSKRLVKMKSYFEPQSQEEYKTAEKARSSLISDSASTYSFGTP